MPNPPQSSHQVGPQTKSPDTQPVKHIVLDPKKEKAKTDADVINLPARTNDNWHCMT